MGDRIPKTEAQATIPRELNPLFDRLDSLEAEKAVLRRNLEKSLAIESLWPGVFSYGRASGQWVQSQGELRFRLKRGDGKEKEWPRNSVPSILRNPKAESDTNAWRRRYGKRPLND